MDKGVFYSGTEPVSYTHLLKIMGSESVSSQQRAYITVLYQAGKALSGPVSYTHLAKTPSP